MPYGTEVKYFHSGLPGAPQVTSTVGTALAVLDACLVNGFGLQTVDSLVVSAGVATATLSTGHSAARWTVISVAGASPAALNGEQRVLDTTTTTTIKFAASGVADGTASGTITVKLAPAGWVKAFAGTHKAAYRSANVAASGILARIADTGTYGYQLHGYQSLSDIDTGSGGFGGHWGLRHYSGSGNKPWFLVANDRFVFFGINYGYSGNYGYTVAAFGDIKSRKAVDPYRFLLRANYGSDGGSPTYASQSIAYCEAGSS